MTNPPLLSVKPQLKSRKGSIEATFEKRIADILTEFAIFSYHTSDRFLGGLPDRYACGGNWIEFKVLPCAGTRRVNPVTLFKPEQKAKLTKLDRSGDRTWAAVMLQPENADPIILIVPWRVMRDHGPWTMAEARKLGCTEKGKALKNYVASRFGCTYDRYSNGELYVNL